MDVLINVLIVVLAAAFLWSRFAPTKGVSQITTAQLRDTMKSKQPGTQYLDVRTPGEYKGNHIKGFKNIPLQQLAKRTGELSQDKEVVVICQSGMRSSQASKLLKKAGFKNVTNVKGGMSAW
ncbi:rhodanese-like domain-containing protein [Mesobacillus subterraneus]|uniref:Rhodanese-like domain-containing protein n=1 Tax=Mesobacillus subterraneus TaxID=285983 RepID=A0A3R9EAZ9_9BACI|nr:rhodanese-like domain-containing protein [Mesobacillus subterraneus]RSD26239.1 rhodanese-like domain-containing protein [Mesobacillus subterraneus]